MMVVILSCVIFSHSEKSSCFLHAGQHEYGFLQLIIDLRDVRIFICMAYTYRWEVEMIRSKISEKGVP